MSETVILELPEDLARHARAIAVRTQRRLEDILLEWIDQAASDVPVSLLTDDEVLALRDLQLDAARQRELDALLAHQREGTLSEAIRVRLDELLAAYRHDMVRKAQALREAVARGLQPPLG
jgi:hypothetical protein